MPFQIYKKEDKATPRPELKIQPRRINLREFFIELEVKLNEHINNWKKDVKASEVEEFKKIEEILRNYIAALDPFKNFLKKNERLGIGDILKLSFSESKLLKQKDYLLNEWMPKTDKAISLMKIFIEALSMILTHAESLDASLLHQPIRKVASEITPKFPFKEEKLNKKFKNPKISVYDFIKEDCENMILEFSKKLDAYFQPLKDQLRLLIFLKIPDAEDKEQTDGYIQELVYNWKIIESFKIATSFGSYTPTYDLLQDFLMQFDKDFGDKIDELKENILSADSESIVDLKIQLAKLEEDIQAYRIVIKDKVEEIIQDLHTKIKQREQEIKLEEQKSPDKKELPVSASKNSTTLVAGRLEFVPTGSISQPQSPPSPKVLSPLVASTPESPDKTTSASQAAPNPQKKSFS